MLSENKKTDIRKTEAQDLEHFFTANNEKSFRVKQVQEWLWKKSVTDFDSMHNLSVKTRELLKNHFVINPIKTDTVQTAKDGTLKSAFRLHDNHLIEGVLIPAKSRMTACVSSQVGCSLSCKFCATGFMDRKRNLDAAEIYDQVVQIRQQAEKSYNTPLTNIVYMGMGEPLLNYKNVLKSVELITSPEGLHMSAKRITVSTAGIAKMITKLGDDEVKFKLALSLHAADDEKRSKIMPINESNSLAALADALRYYYQKTGNRVTFEYIAFDNFNDSEEDAEKLFKFTKKVPSKVNIIEYNPIAQADFDKSGPDRLDRFSAVLEDKGVNVQVRRSRGKDIDAACGQLAGNSTDK